MLYRNVAHIGRVKAASYRKYEREFATWCLIHRPALHKVVKALQGEMSLVIKLNFQFLHGRLFCKDGRIKKLDVSNRLKCFLDLLSKALLFDDSRFFEINCKKTVALREGVDIKIDFHKTI